MSLKAFNQKKPFFGTEIVFNKKLHADGKDNEKVEDGDVDESNCPSCCESASLL